MEDLAPPKTVTDPPKGATQIVAPGERVELRLTCRNDADKVVTFSAEIEGLGPWAETRPRAVAPFDVGAVLVTVAPSADAASGDYPFSVRLLLDGDPFDPLVGVLRIQGEGAAALPPAEFVVAKNTVDPPIVSQPIGEDPKTEPVVVAPVVLEPPQVEAALVENLKPEPPKPIPIPVSEARVVAFEEPEPIEEEEKPLAVSADRQIADPAEGAVVAVKPGETVLVTFSVHNDKSGVRTFVLQEDRSLAADWISLVRDQVNVTAGGSGDVALLLKPPVGAEPGGYPLTASFGLMGQPLASCYLTLQVMPVPAVSLAAPKASNGVFAPLSRFVPFDLKVASNGNTDTAYRVAVTEENADEEGVTRLRESYETPAWRYVFDKEIASLVSPRAGAPATAIVHRLRIVRKGVWWLGWRERHRVNVRAIPVTDPANGAKTGNVATLVASRWRILPLPAFVMLPLAALGVVLLSSGASDFRVTNAKQGDDGTYYVVGTPNAGSQQEVHLRWSAPFYALLRLNRVQEGASQTVPAGRGEAKDAPTVAEYGQAQRTGYEIGPRLVGGSEGVAVRFVPTRTQGKLALSAGLGEAKAETVGDEKVKVAARDVTVSVPRSGSARLNFQNLTGANGGGGQTIVLWTTHAPTGFRVNDFLTSGGNQPINPGATLTAKIRVDGSGPSSGEEVWEMLTTDGAPQLLRIHLKVAP